MLLPTGATSFTEAMKMGSEVYHHLSKVIKEKYGQDATSVGDEGGFAPNIQNNKEGLNLLNDAIAKAGYTGKVEIGMDIAASEFFKDGEFIDCQGLIYVQGVSIWVLLNRIRRVWILRQCSTFL